MFDSLTFLTIISLSEKRNIDDIQNAPKIMGGENITFDEKYNCRIFFCGDKRFKFKDKKIINKFLSKPYAMNMFICLCLTKVFEMCVWNRFSKLIEFCLLSIFRMHICAMFSVGKNIFIKLNCVILSKSAIFYIYVNVFS